MSETVKLVLALDPHVPDQARIIINDTTICCDPLSAMDCLFDELRLDVSKALTLLNIDHSCCDKGEVQCKP